VKPSALTVVIVRSFRPPKTSKFSAVVVAVPSALIVVASR
jgi:hypothetical protein